jgi:hypothetical protein
MVYLRTHEAYQMIGKRPGDGFEPSSKVYETPTFQSVNRPYQQTIAMPDNSPAHPVHLFSLVLFHLIGSKAFARFLLDLNTKGIQL